MKVDLTSILGLIIVILLGIIFFQKDPKSDSQRKVVIPVHIPAQRGIILSPNSTLPGHVPVYIPYKQKVDTTLLNAFRRENDSLKKELLYRDAITERWYKETFEDSLVSIEVKYKVRGYLLKSSISSYTIKPKDTSVTYLPPREFNLYLGGELGVPITPLSRFGLKGAALLERRNRIYSLGYDTNGVVWGGLYFKLL